MERLVKLTINGEEKEYINHLTIQELLKDLNIDSKRVAVELNSNIIPRYEMSKRGLKDGDKIEIVTFVGGG